MAQIQSTTGLVSGIDIAGTVEKLMAIAGKPRDLLTAKNTTLKNQQTAITKLTALMASFQYITDNLGKEGVFNTRSAESNNSTLLTASVTGSPATGSYQYTPLKVAQTAQWISSGVKDKTAALGGGTMSFRFGNDVENSSPLDLLGSGQGFVRGKIRISDRSGASAEIDLSGAQSIDDVIDAINGDTSINVTATVVGDHLRLIDNTGETTSNLKVQEVNSGTTAASLGLAGINSSESSAAGQDIVRLTEDTELAMLNDGNGVNVDPTLPDITYTLRNGTSGSIDLSAIVSGSSTVNKETTLGDVLEVINAAQPGLLKAEIAPSGDRLMITDLSEGSGTFTLTSLPGSEALADLGLNQSQTDGVITGRRIVGGLKSVLLSSLNGGQGLGQLGTVELTDRSGTTRSVDLSDAETLADVVDTINAAGLGITASVNAAKNGIQLVDTTGSTGRNLIVTDGDSTATATRLGITVNAAVTTKNGGDLHLKVVSGQTSLSDLNGGEGVAEGTFTIVDSKGNRTKIDLTRTGLDTVADVIREINRMAPNVRAELNSTGDGIALEDASGGTGTLQIEEGSTTTAKDLHLLKSAETVDGSQVIDGSMTTVIELDDDDTFEDLKTKINDAAGGLQASIFTDGSKNPYRLSLSSQVQGTAGRMVVDMSGLGISLEQTVTAQDAVLVIGSGRSTTPIMATSSNNQFTEILAGVTLTVKGATDSPVTITVKNTDTSVVTNVQAMVDNYNKVRDELTTDMAYDTTTNKAAVLSGDPTALRLDTEVPQLLTSVFYGAGTIKSLQELGISIGTDGKLSLDQSTLKTKYADDPDAVKQFFTQEDTGFSAKAHDLLEQLCGVDNSLLSSRSAALDITITDNEDRITAMNARLDAQEEAMTLKFYNLELIIQKLQNSLSAVNNIKSLDPLALANDSSS